MRQLGFLLFVGLGTHSVLAAQDVKTQKIIKDVTVTKNINVTVQEGRGDIYKDQKSFCALSKAEAEKLCKSWLQEQKKNLKNNVLTSHCSAAESLYGQEKDGCMSHYVRGELTWLIK
jgi:hypothetical protein